MFDFDDSVCDEEFENCLNVPFWMYCGESFCFDCEYLDWENSICLKQESVPSLSRQEK